MTSPLSSSLDLGTLNAARKVASTALKAYVCELEQKALDAARCRDYQAAKLNSDWAFAADLCPQGLFRPLRVDCGGIERSTAQEHRHR